MCVCVHAHTHACEYCARVHMLMHGFACACVHVRVFVCSVQVLYISFGVSMVVVAAVYTDV
jgi:hypothetical protein